MAGTADRLAAATAARPGALRLHGETLRGEGFRRRLHAAAHRRLERREREDVALGVAAAEALGDAADGAIFSTASRVVAGGEGDERLGKR